MRFLAALLLLVPFVAFGQGTASLVCTAPTTYTNGAPIGTAAITYKFSRGAALGGPFNLETKSSSTCSATFTGLASGPINFCADPTPQCRDGNKTGILVEYVKGGKDFDTRVLARVSFEPDFGL